MEDHRYAENKNWTEKVFQVCGVMQPPEHLVAHYSECLSKGTITYEHAQNEILSLSKGSLRQVPVHGPPKETDSKLAKVKEFVDQLYINYTGSKGDPASTNYLVNSIMQSDFSLTQAEYFVKFSKEAKQYAKTKSKVQQEQRLAQIQEFVRELFRVYTRNPLPSPEEIKEYVDPIVLGSRTLQDVEDEFKLQALSPPS